MSTVAVNAASKRTNLFKLSEADQNVVCDAVNDLMDRIRDDNGEVRYDLLLGVVDFIGHKKKLAKLDYDAGAKERKEAEKQSKEATGRLLQRFVSVGDVVDYSMASKKLVIKGVKIQKITQKRFHVEIEEDTDVQLSDGSVVKAAGLADFTLGKKYVAFEAITSINGGTTDDFLASKDY